MSSSCLHVVFSPSAAASFRTALREFDIPGTVVAFFDDLTLGPINPPDPSSRATWFETQLNVDLDVTTEVTKFWDTALSWSGPRVVWTSHRLATERAGFCEWVLRAGNHSYSVADLTSATITMDFQGRSCEPHGPVLPMLSPMQIAQSGVLRLAEPISATLRDSTMAVWAKLRDEDAPVRRFEHGELVSAPITTWDALLLSYTSNEWRKAAWVVGSALSDEQFENLYQVSDILLFSRLRALVEHGVLQSKSNLHSSRHGNPFSVRQPDKRI